jgi:hypothetical protein
MAVVVVVLVVVVVVIVTDVHLRIWKENHLTYFSISVLTRH